jgi:hypothetical protein
MLDWSCASRYELRLLYVYKRIFCKHDKLLAFLFESKLPQLKRDPKELLQDMGVFSSGEQILIRIALDLWDGSGGTYLWDIFQGLDRDTLLDLLQGLEYLGLIPSNRADQAAPIKNGMLV